MKLTTAILACFLALWIGCVPVVATQYRLALPGYKFKFPADHGSHNDFKTEWWYYTGHLQTQQGRKFGYEVTFFRSAIDLPDGVKSPRWQLNQLYLAHFAVSDLQEKKFFFDEKLNRSGGKIAGAEAGDLIVWNQNWSVKRVGAQQHLQASSGSYKLDLLLESRKPPVLHGADGVSQKASCKGCASHYYSMTRLLSRGSLVIDGKSHLVTGTSWMDHEFGSNQLTKEQIGWDWFSIQLDDGTELMLYVMRRRDGSLDPNSSGTFVSADGAGRHLTLSEYKIEKGRRWKSPLTGGNYPAAWAVSIPSLRLELKLESLLENQELATKQSTGVTYWEGACSVTGARGGKPLKGEAYVEMTGYAEEFSKKI